MTKEVDSLTNQLTALYVENKQLKASLEAERMENKEFQRSHEKFYNAAIAHKNCKRTQKAQEVKIQEATKAKAEIAKKIEKQRSDFETKVITKRTAWYNAFYFCAFVH